MLRYLIRRLLYAVPILIGVNLITFALFFMVNSPDDMARMQLGVKRVTPAANNWNNTLRFELNDSNWLKESFATISLSSTFNQNKVSGFETRTGGYSLLNLGLGGTLHFGRTKVEVNLNGNNITNKKYIAHLSRLKADGISNIGRNIVLGLNFNL